MTDRIKVFVSHSTEDDDIVNKIVSYLESAGLEYWIDHIKGLPLAVDWHSKIQDAVHSCHVGLFIMTANSVKSAYCEAEWTRLLNLKKPLYIARLDNIPLEERPLRLDTIQMQDCTGDKFESGIVTLIRDIAPNSLITSNEAVRSKPIGNWSETFRDIPLIGRDTILTDIQQALREKYRLVLLRGIGGIGKTRLAAEVAHQGGYRDGVIWHKITQQSSITDLTLMLCDCLGIDRSTDIEKAWQILDRRQCLIILDNAEDCSNPDEYANRINKVDLDGGTRFLMTSRVSWLQFNKARVFDIAKPEDAVEIFKAMLARTRPPFAVKGFETQLVDAAHHHPRLLENVVESLNYLPADKVLRQLSAFKGDVEDVLRDMVGKTLEQIKQQNGGLEALNALSRLCIFRGGFSYEAAEYILVGNISAMKLLRDWGILTIENNRYDIDPLVKKTILEDISAVELHYQYYLQHARDLSDREQYLELEPELQNIERAFTLTFETADYLKAFNIAAISQTFLINRGLTAKTFEWFEKLYANMSYYTSTHLATKIFTHLSIAHQNLKSNDNRFHRQKGVEFAELALSHSTESDDFFWEILLAHSKSLRVFAAYIDDEDERVQNRLKSLASALLALQHCPPENKSTVYLSIGVCLRGLSKLGASYLEDANTNLTYALQFSDSTKRPLELASINNWRGNVLYALAFREEPVSVKKLRDALDSYENALRYYKSPRNYLNGYVATLVNLGMVKTKLARRQDTLKYLNEAVFHLEQALMISSPETNLTEYRRAIINLDDALYEIAEIEHPLENIGKLIDWRTKKVETYDSRIDPRGYVQSTRELGLAYVEYALHQIRENDDPKQALMRASNLFSSIDNSIKNYANDVYTYNFYVAKMHFANYIYTETTFELEQCLTLLDVIREKFEQLATQPFHSIPWYINRYYTLYADCQFIIGTQNANQFHFQKALSFYEKAANIVYGQGLIIRDALLKISMARILAALGKQVEARSKLLEAEPVLRRLDHGKDADECLSLLENL